MKNRICLLFYISFCYISCIAQLTEQPYTNMYDLHFTMKADSLVIYPWLENAAYANYTLPVCVNDSVGRLFARKYMKGFPFLNCLKTEYQQRLLLPVHQEKEGCIVFESRGSNIKSVSIQLDGINSEEKIVFSDTLTFVPDSFLSRISKTIELTNVELLNIRINAEGEIDKDALIVFSKLEILIGDKTIDQFPVRKLQTPFSQKEIKYIPVSLDTGNGFEKIEDLKASRIIAFGESVHGNVAVKNLVYRLIMQTVETQNCKLIIWEKPLEKSLVLNRYIQNDNFNLDSFLSVDRQTTDFLNELRLYNSGKTDEDKIRILGMDYNPVFSSGQNSAIDIFDFVTQLNYELKIPEIDQLAVLLMEKDWSKGINYLETHRKKIQKLLTADEIECIRHILDISGKMKQDGIQRLINRDSIMFINTVFLIDKISSAKDKKIVIYGHGVHINPVSTFPAVPCRSFGNYMQEIYSKDYFPLLFLIGNGQTMAYDTAYNIKNNLLDKSPDTSMEFFLNTFKSDVFYFPLTSGFNRLILSRFEGSHHTFQEFYPFNLYQRYKGIFFIRNSYRQNNDKELSFDETLKKIQLKNRQRQTVLSEIQERIGK